MELSYRTENFLKRITLSAVDYTPSTGTTRPGALTPCELAGVLAGLPNEREKLVMLLLAGAGDQRVYSGLIKELIKSVDSLPWVGLIKEGDPEQATKLGVAAFLAVQELQGQTRMNANQKANALGISNQCFYKTWRGRIDDFNRLLMQWAHDADAFICRALR